MKANLVRATVVLLALTGFGASRAALTASHAPTLQAETDPSGPTPMCPPNDPNGCGIH